MATTGKYVIDKHSILEKCYDFLCLFFSNKEIARKSNPNDPDAPLASLERMFFETKASRLLLEIAVSVRVIDDQMYTLPKDDPLKTHYENLRGEVDKYSFGLFDNLDLNLRKTCNKIIHSNVLEPHTTKGFKAHALDDEFWYGDADQKTIDWTHYNGYVRLSGFENKTEWYVLLNIEVFVSAIYNLFSKL